MSRIAVLYSTVDGHTQDICEYIRDRYEAMGHEVLLCSLDGEIPADDLGRCDRFLIGASIRYGKHRPNVKAFADRFRDLLSSHPGAFFSVNLVARKPGRDGVESNPYLKKLLRSLDWQPNIAIALAGKLEYPRYRFLDRQVIRLIMWVTKGPTEPTAIVDFTDYGKVDVFADRLLEL